MNLQHAKVARPADAVPTHAQSAVITPSHEASLLHGATSTGEAGRRQLSIRVGLWLDDKGGVRRARWRTVDDPALRTFAETACSLLEAGLDPLRLDGEMLRGSTAGVIAHGDRADLVVLAVQAATTAAGGPT
jgi:hypothetical protein